MKISIAIVEDLDEVREGIQHFLSVHERFHFLDSFRNVEESLFYLPKLQPDIVIMDINLPGMSGVEGIRELKPQLKTTQFMMFTVYDTDEKVFEALKAGASGYLLKNTPLPQLAEALMELHEGGAPMSSSIARKLVNAFQKKESSANLDNELTRRENEILELLAKGLLYKEISASLQISTSTVKQHIHKIYEKLHVQNRTEALNKVYGKK